MKYLQKTPFSVPVAGPSVTQADWDAIFGKKNPSCPKCGESDPEPLEGRKFGCMACGHVWPRKGKRT